MRIIIYILIIALSLPTTLLAADPIIGTWKEKSVDDPKIKEAFLIYSEIEDGMIEFSTRDVLKDGTTDSSKWVFPKEGGILKRLSSKIEEELMYVGIFPEPNHLIISITKNGRQVAMYNKIISKDGNTLTQTLTVIEKDGKPMNVKKVFEKQ